eukprot:g6297.t1
MYRPQEGLVTVTDEQLGQSIPRHGSNDDVGNNMRGDCSEERDRLFSAPSHMRQQPRPPSQPLLDAPTGRRGAPVAPAHGGAGHATAVPGTTNGGNATGRAGGGGRVGAARQFSLGKVRGGSSRVARLGSALDDVETRANRAAGVGGLAARDRSGEKLNLPCTKRHIKIIRAMTLGDSSGAGTTAEHNANTSKPNNGGNKTNSASKVRATTPTEGATAAATSAAAASPGKPAATALAGSALVAHATAAAAAPIEGAVSLKTVGKTVAFLAKLAAPAAGGREGDGGAFGGGGKMAGTGGTGSAYGLRQCWYSAAAAKNISEEIHDEGDDLEDGGEAALGLERRLHAPPAIQFLSESRRGGFNKGSTITYGSTITLQAFHGGILCFNSKGKAQASALGAQPNALLTVWNLQDLQSNGPVRYGDVLLLQMGRHEVMGSSLIMHKEPKPQGGLSSSKQTGGTGPHASAGGAGEQDTEEAARDRSAAGVRTGPLKSSAVGNGGGFGGGAGAAVGNPVAVPFRGKNMDKAKHTGRWVIFHKDDPEGTQGLDVCHLDKVVLMQTWLTLASDRPDDACLKQCGSVDDFCHRQQQLTSPRSAKAGIGGGRRGEVGDGASSRGGGSRGRGASGPRVDGAGEGRGSRSDEARSVFAVRPECGWVVSGVEDSGSGKNTGGAGRRSSATLLEGAAARQLRRSKNARLIVATNALVQMRCNERSIVLKAQDIFDEAQRRRLASLGEKFLRAFRRERSRDWLPNRGSDRQLSIVYGPSSPWGKREALRLQREHNKLSEKVTAKAKTVGDVRNPSSFEAARAENGALATEAKVKQEVWDALLKRYGYQEVTDMLALMHSASVIRRAVRAMRQRKWTRKLARIDPEMVEKVERLRKIQEQRKANMRGGASTSSTARGTDTATSATNLANSEGERIDDAFDSGPSAHAGPTTGAAVAGPASSDPAQRQPHPYEALLAGSLEKFENDHRGPGGGGGGGAGRSSVRPQTTGGTRNVSHHKRPPSSGPSSRRKPLGARGGNDGAALRDEHGGEREDRWREKGQQSQPRARPKTAGAGSGGVQGVLARMGGYDESAFREFGGDGRGGVVDQQLSRDLVLLEDLRGTLNHVMGWDHTQGGLDPAAGGSIAGANQDKGVVVDPTLAGASATAVDQHTTSKTSSLSEGSGGKATASRGLVQQDGRSIGVLGEDRSSAGKSGMMEHIPLAVGRRVESDRGGGQKGDGGTENTQGASEELRVARGARNSTASRRSSGGVTCNAATRTVSSDDSGSTTTSTTTISSGSCIEWVRKQRKRAAPTPLTDGERMSLLQHVRPSVFGEPTAVDQRRRKAVAYPRPRSAAAIAVGSAFRHCHHDPPRASTARIRSRAGGWPGGTDAAGHIHRASGCSSGIGDSKHRGILVHDGWVAGEAEPPSGSLSMSTGAGQASPRGSRLRPGSFDVSSGSGSARQVSLVNSVAFGVNMGVLDALSDTTASATAATAFASAAAGETTTTTASKSLSSATLARRL